MNDGDGGPFRLEAWLLGLVQGIVSCARIGDGEPAHFGSIETYLVRADGEVFPISAEELEGGVLPARLVDAFAGQGEEIEVRQDCHPDCGIPPAEVVEWVLRSWTEYPGALESGDQCHECHEILMAAGAQPPITGPPSARDLADAHAWWQVATSPSGRCRVVFRAQPGPSHWWLLDGDAVTAEGPDAIYHAVVGDSGRGLLVIPQVPPEWRGAFMAEAVVGASTGTGDVVEQEVRLVGQDEARTVTVLPDWVRTFQFLNDRYLLIQNGWSFRGQEARPDDERLVQVWDLSAANEFWTAQPRFVADRIELDPESQTVTLRSERYGKTVPRLTDGFLVSDRIPRLSARPPRYPGVVEGVRIVGRRTTAKDD